MTTKLQKYQSFAGNIHRYFFMSIVLPFLVCFLALIFDHDLLAEISGLTVAALFILYIGGIWFCNHVIKREKENDFYLRAMLFYLSLSCPRSDEECKAFKEYVEKERAMSDHPKEPKPKTNE